MFADASSLRRASALLLLALFAAALFSLTGCSEEEVVDPYVVTSINRVMDGDTLSTDFLFEVDAPALDYAKQNVAIVSTGNRKHFLIGPDIEHQYASWANSKLRVEKRFSHGADTPHLFLKEIKNGLTITPVDSVTSYLLPSVFTASKTQVETPGAPLPDLDWQRVSRIEEFYPQNEGDPLIEVQSIVSKFVRVPAHDLAAELAANPGPENYAWYAVFPNSTFRIVDLGDGAEWMLEVLKHENLPLVGSFSIARVEDSRVERRKEYEGLGHICGDIKVNWFKYANTFIHGDR